MHNANGMVVFLCNNDIEFREPALQYMADAVMATKAGVIGTRLLYPDMRIQHGGVVFVPTQGQENPGYFDHFMRNGFHLDPAAVTMRPSLVTGALMGIPRPTIDLVGYLDETFEFTAEDIDYCLRTIETGRDSLYFGYTSAIHAEGATRGKTPEEKKLLAPDVAEKEARSLKHLFQKWEGINWSFAQGG
jgi:GT2 family glycosyltransferase